MALPLITSRTSPNTSRRGSRIRRIVIHHWDDPSKRPTLAGTVSWLCNPRSKVSAHYVVSERTVYRLVPEGVAAWHARGGNDDAIGIECDPRQQDSTYETVAALIRDIRSRHGDLPLVRHRDVRSSSTTCPGTFDLARLDRLARGAAPSRPAPAPSAAPAFPLPAGFYYGPADGPVESVSGRGPNDRVGGDVLRGPGGRWYSKGLRTAQQRLKDRGWTITVDGRWGDETADVLAEFKHRKRPDWARGDSRLGPETWALLWSEPVR